MRADDLLTLVRGLEHHDLDHWLERGWIRPSRNGDTADYRAVDVARIRLICELRHDLAVNDEGIGVALDLLDQLYGTRAQLHALGRAVLQQPEQVRREIEALMRDLLEA